MVKQFKNLMLNKYLNFRLNYFKSNEDLCDYPAKIGTIKKVLLILPAECKDKTEYRDFINGLNQVFQKAKISTFQIKDLRLHEQNWLGVPNERYLDELRSQNFDLIIDLNIRPDKICAYICALSEAPVRINLVSGKYDHVYNLYFRSEQEKSIDERYQLILSNLAKLKLA
ncbi:MAG: hypothetical protein JW956_10270 [Calditrichaceae bacterium]|nr:hypothetical protein [Calditrichaceae bacterium]HES60216.1 hypothetical protein [Caldithrix sp.]